MYLRNEVCYVKWFYREVLESRCEMCDNCVQNSDHYECLKLQTFSPLTVKQNLMHLKI